MLDAAELENPIPRVRAALQKNNARAMWRIADRASRILWCSMAHEDFRVYPSWPWEQLPPMTRTKLDLALWGAVVLLNRFVELAPPRE